MMAGQAVIKLDMSLFKTLRNNWNGGQDWQGENHWCVLMKVCLGGRNRG